MEILKTVNGLAALAALSITAAATPFANTSRNKVPRDITVHGNFFEWCGNITPNGASTSTIQASCGYGSAGASVQYHSHINLNQCLTNTNGQISGVNNGNAMQSCDLGLSGRNACTNCNGAWFTFECRTLSSNHTSLVNLDNYIGLVQATNAAGHAVWVLSCSADAMTTGEFDSCTIDGAYASSC